MAVLIQLPVGPATQDRFNALDDKVGEAMDHAGGPPAGLMSLVVHEEGDGFVIAGVWRAEPEGLAYLDEVVRPLLADLRLSGREVVVRQVWAFAQP